MIYVDNISVTPNQAETGKTVKIEVTLHEEYENAKRYAYRYPYRYAQEGETK